VAPFGASTFSDASALPRTAAERRAEVTDTDRLQFYFCKKEIAARPAQLRGARPVRQYFNF